VCTYLLVANHNTASTWIQDHRVIIWILPWFFSLLCGGLGLGLVGYGFGGAYCLFTSDEIRLLVNYVPRWIIIITILCLYIRLFRLIHNIRKESNSLDYLSSTAPIPEEKPATATKSQGPTIATDDGEEGLQLQRRRDSASSRRLKRVCLLPFTK
jgi:hypothetical protein